MNKHIQNPFIVTMMPASSAGVVEKRGGNRVYVPTNVQWSQFQNSITPIKGDDFDSVIVQVNDSVDLDEKGMAKNLDIKMTTINKFANESNKAVLNKRGDEWYWLNPKWGDQDYNSRFAPTDDTVMAKYESFGSDMDWQKHQAKIWSRMAETMPLEEGKYRKDLNHIAVLTDPKRGLEQKDLDGFWGPKKNRNLNPAIMGDDMVGMPSVQGFEHDGFTMTPSKGPNAGVTEPINVKSLRTNTSVGYAIPMANVDGYTPKYQIGTDVDKSSVELKARAKDGVTIQHSAFYNKKEHKYQYVLDGGPSNLQVESANGDGSKIVFSDAKGTFETSMKSEIKDILVKRGYEIPEIMDTISVTQGAKYIWQSKGSMVGSDKVSKIVSPSNAGFIQAREPKNGAKDNVLLIVEGALKGHIVAKYIDVQDKNGKSFGDSIARDSGVIVAQVPGTAKAFIKSVTPAYGKFDIKGTYIAMDADGRENYAVAKGIHDAQNILSKHSPVKVLSWDPAHKGLDDALLSVAQNKISLDEMDIHFGTAEKLFPLEQASKPNPYKLDGTRVNRQEWQDTYSEAKKSKEAEIRKLQEETQKRAKDLMENGKDLADCLPSDLNDKSLEV